MQSTLCKVTYKLVVETFLEPRSQGLSCFVPRLRTENKQQLLGSSQGEHWDETAAASIHDIMDSVCKGQHSSLLSDTGEGGGEGEEGGEEGGGAGRGGREGGGGRGRVRRRGGGRRRR